MSEVKIFFAKLEDLSVRVEIPKEAVPHILMLSESLEDFGHTAEAETVIPIPRTEDQHVLDLLLEYITLDLANPLPEKEKEEVKKDLSEWETNFFRPLESLDTQTYLFGLNIISNFTNYKRLFNATCLKIAQMIDGKTPQQIRDTFGLPDDLTDDEKNELALKSGWKPRDTSADTASAKS